MPCYWTDSGPDSRTIKRLDRPGITTEERSSTIRGSSGGPPQPTEKINERGKNQGSNCQQDE